MAASLGEAQTEASQQIDALFTFFPELLSIL